MKICILSMQKVPNFGSLLQSYSLKKILESLGHEVAFIDIEKRDEDNKLIAGYTNNFVDEREKSFRIWGKLNRVDRYVINRIKIKVKNTIQEKNFEKFRKEILDIKESNNKKQYDLCVIGSDEVFNCLANTPWGFTTQLFGNVTQAKKVITYAASCGATKYDSVPPIARDRIKEAFLNIEAFSVRDMNTFKFVNQLTAKSVEMHFDPVMIGNFDEELNKCILSKKLPEHYCIVYSYYNRIHKKREIEAIRSFCKKKQLKIVSIGAPQMWISTHLILNPFEVLLAFKRADFIVTDTFHGTIFSAKYAKKFGIIIRDSNRNKLFDLLQKLDKTEHIIHNMCDISNIYNINNNIKKVQAFADIERTRTIKYLKKKV